MFVPPSCELVRFLSLAFSSPSVDRVSHQAHPPADSRLPPLLVNRSGLLTRSRVFGIAASASLFLYPSKLGPKYIDRPFTLQYRRWSPAIPPYHDRGHGHLYGNIDRCFKTPRPPFHSFMHHCQSSPFVNFGRAATRLSTTEVGVGLTRRAPFVPTMTRPARGCVSGVSMRVTRLPSRQCQSRACSSCVPEAVCLCTSWCQTRWSFLLVGQESMRYTSLRLLLEPHLRLSLNPDSDVTFSGAW